MNEVVQAKGVNKIYGMRKEFQVQALFDIDLTISSGDYVCVMGPSGAGKSTLLNVLTTIDAPTSGSVEIAGQKVTRMTEAQICAFRYQHLGFIFQEFNLIEALPIYENIAVPLTMAGVPSKTIQERVTDIAGQLGLTNQLNKYPPECSGGQRQRAAIARALITQPELIVADEPTGNLDSQNSHDVMTIFSRLNAAGVTILMVTHDAMIASYSSRLVYISDGRITKTITRGDLSQNAYFDEIVAVNAQSRKDVMA